MEQFLDLKGRRFIGTIFQIYFIRVIYGMMNNMQDKIWKSIFGFFYPVTDCTPLIFIMVTGMAAILFFFLRRNLLHKTYTLGLFELPFLLSIQYFTEQLPRLHKRVQLALSTTAEIIMQSADYAEEFQTVSDIQSLSNASISRYSII